MTQSHSVNNTVYYRKHKNWSVRKKWDRARLAYNAHAFCGPRAARSIGIDLYNVISSAVLILSFTMIQVFISDLQLNINIYEPHHEKTNILVSDLVRHQLGCTALEDG